MLYSVSSILAVVIGGGIWYAAENRYSAAGSDLCRVLSRRGVCVRTGAVAVFRRVRRARPSGACACDRAARRHGCAAAAAERTHRHRGDGRADRARGHSVAAHTCRRADGGAAVRCRVHHDGRHRRARQPDARPAGVARLGARVRAHRSGGIFRCRRHGDGVHRCRTVHDRRGAHHCGHPAAAHRADRSI